MKLIRSKQEIKDKIDELAYFVFCDAQSGRDDYTRPAQFNLLKWLLGDALDIDLYQQGEKVYKSGVRYEWNTSKREFEKKI
jgi:hypothetical protein